LDEFLIVCAARSCDNVAANRKAGCTQLLCLAVKATLVEAVSNSMECYRQIHRLVPDREILKALVRPSPPAAD
jgi:hypothetical protein